MRWIARLAPVLLGLTAACGADFWSFETNNLSGGATILVVRWSDSPVDEAESVVVALDRLELVGADASEVLLDERRSYDLLLLRNGAWAELARASVPTGAYEGLRFVLAPEAADVNRVRVRGESHPLRYARPDGHVIELAYPVELPAGSETEIHVEFHVRMSVVEAGGAWVLDPRLRAIDPAGAGALRGRVEGAGGAPFDGATVSAQQDGAEVLATRSAPDGTFHIGPLPPGRYALVATAPGHAPASRPDVEVRVGDETGGHVLALRPVEAGGLAGLAPPGRVGLTVRVIGAAGLVALAGVDPLTGAFVVPALAPGLHVVELWDGPVRLGVLSDVLVVAGETTTLLF